MNTPPVRHAGLDPASTFLNAEFAKEGGSRIKSGMTIDGSRAKELPLDPCAFKIAAVADEADISAILDVRHAVLRDAFMRRDLAAYRAMFSEELHYRQADGRVIDRAQLLHDVEAQFRRLDHAETSSIREALEVDGANYTETVRQTARASATAFGFVRRIWQVERHARWTWANADGVWRIVRVEVLDEKVRGSWALGRRAQAPT